MKKRFKRCFLFVLALLLVSCGKRQQEEKENGILLFYVSNSETKVLAEAYALQSMQADVEKQVEEIAEALTKVPDKLEYKPPLAMGFSLRDYELAGNRLTLDVDGEYKRLKVATEVLVRAALVRSFTQIKGIDYVSITVEGESLRDNLGNVVGAMAADQFIDNAGREINNNEEVLLKLYFANETGDGFVTVNRRVAYNTNISVEKLVVEQLLAGTEITETGCYPTISPGVELNSVSVKDGVCYVNFGENFLSQPIGIPAEITIYSLVNSLTELSGITKVQFLINGETNVMYREMYGFTTLFERNLSL